jgi:LPS-assembly protein
MCVSLLVAKNFELLANKINTENNITTAEGNVVVQGPNYYIQADKAVYDKSNEIMELFGNVNTIRDSKMYSISNYAKIDMKNDCSTANPLFLLNDDSGIWFSAKEAKSDKNIFTLHNSTISSCNTLNPVWSISFKEGKFDRDDQWIKLYHPTFYIGDVPIGYLPFFAFPTSDKRRSGLLIPSFSLSSNEGFSYIQPIYFAPFNDWDVEISPQFRGNRGLGAYTTARFVGDDYKGTFRAGYFDNKSSWVDKYALDNDKVIGLEFDYVDKNVVADTKGHEDGLYMNLKTYNDVDYLTLKDFDTTSTDTIANSRINYYYKSDDYYYGAYFIYESDTTKASNDDTVQTLPSLQFHKFSKNIFIDDLLYNLDYKVKNYTRKTGVNAVEQQLLLPISYYKTIFDGFLTLELSENIFISDINYHNSSIKTYEDGNFFRNYHKLGISTNLIKEYSDFIHNFDLELSYTIPSYSKKEGDIYGITTDDEEIDFITYNLQRENTQINFSQYFYDRQGRQIIKHTANQTIFFEGTTNKYADLSNDFVYYISDYLTMSHKNRYSHEYSNFPYSSTSLTYEIDNDFDISVTHSKKDDEIDQSEYVIVDAKKKLDYKYDVEARFEYDIKDSYKKKQEIGLSMTKSCWAYKVKYVQDIIPQNSALGSIHDNKILFEINFIPMGGFVYSMQRD